MITNIALVAHDSRKQELLDWVRYNAGSLKHCHLFCTGTTGRLVSEALTEKLGPEALYTSEHYKRIIPNCIDSYKNRKL